MQIIKYYEATDQAHWKKQIGQGDWSAAKLLYTWLEKDELKKNCGNSAEVYLLTDGDNLVSFAVLAEQDEIEAPELSPWIGFVYTSEKYRGCRNAGKLITHICDTLKQENIRKVYVSTEEVGLYEKYGFSFHKTMLTRDGKKTRVYVREV